MTGGRDGNGFGHGESPAGVTGGAPRRWTRGEYERLIDLGVLAGGPLELLGGQLVVAEPQSSYHASAVARLDYALRAVLPPGWLVRVKAPLSLDDESEPEPDLAVVPGAPEDYWAAHPTRAALVVEVADASLAFDRERKGGLYARAGLEDYWLVDLAAAVLEVHRDPGPDPAAVHGWRYRAVARLVPPAVIAPLTLPSARLAVADLLPRQPRPG